MNEFERVLQKCLSDLERGATSVEQCLSRHPEHAPRLQPILLADAYLRRGGEVHPSEAFKARVRARLTQQMQAQVRPHPRRSLSVHSTRARFAVSAAVLLLAVMSTGTVYAQGALPGEVLHAWKLASENVWRIISPDRVSTDIAIAERRLAELIAVRGDPVLYAQALNRYLEAAARLRTEMNGENETLIFEALTSHLKELGQWGILDPQIEQEVLPQVDEPEFEEVSPPPLLSTPVVSPLAPAVDPIDDSADSPIESPTEDPGGLPQILPTIQVPTLLP